MNRPILFMPVNSPQPDRVPTDILFSLLGTWPLLPVPS